MSPSFATKLKWDRLQNYHPVPCTKINLTDMIKHFYSENVYEENASYYESQSIIFYAYLVSVPPKRLNIRYIFYILEMLDCSTQTRQGAARKTWWDVSTGECLLSGADSNTQRRLNAKIQILQYSNTP